MGATKRTNRESHYRSNFSSLVAIGGDPKLSQTSADGGGVLWLELLRCSGVLRNLPVPVAGTQGWVDGQMMLAAVLLNVVGHDRVSDVDALEEDHSLCRLMRKYEPEILGIPAKALSARFRDGRERTFPSANAVHDWLGRFRDAAAAATREALPTYRSATGAVPGERGYQPLSVFCPELGMVLGTEFRDGNVPASMRNLELLERVLSNLPAEIKWVGVRSDGAAHQKKLIRFLNDPASRPEPLRRFGVIGFVIGVPQDAQMRKALAQTPASW